jgi:hypothetical protein
MEAFYPLLTVFSMVLFGWLGWRMAAAKERNPQAWLALGALFPPLLLVLKVLPALNDDADEAEDEAETA